MVNIEAQRIKWYPKWLNCWWLINMSSWKPPSFYFILFYEWYSILVQYLVENMKIRQHIDLLKISIIDFSIQLWGEYIFGLTSWVN